MLTVIYSKEGLPISDFEAEAFVESASKKEGDTTLNISSEIVLNYFRVYILEGKIPHNKIKFVIDGEDVQVDKNGTLQRYPSTSALDDSLHRLLV